jgi:hypothetical protein
VGERSVERRASHVVSRMVPARLWRRTPGVKVATERDTIAQQASDSGESDDHFST